MTFPFLKLDDAYAKFAFDMFKNGIYPEARIMTTHVILYESLGTCLIDMVDDL